MTMNREFRFRGKRIDNGEWVYGDLENCRIRKCTFIHCYTEDGNYHKQHEVDAETIGQYTGLKDKNGKDIYEGDIVRWTRYNVNAEGIHNVTWVDDCTIYWNDAKHAFWKHYDFENGGGASGMLDFKDERAEYIEYEVIGNIYDTPQLLKGGEE